MLVLKRRPDDFIVLTFPHESGLDPIEVTILDNVTIGIEALDEEKIARSELLENQL